MKSEIKLLVLEDIEEDFQLIERSLVQAGLQFDIKHVDNRADFEQGLTQFYPDVVLSDHSLPQFNSLDAFAITRQYHPRIPFIIVTGNVSEEFAVNSIKLGVDDYVLKSNLDRLPQAIQTAIQKREDEQRREIELRALEENNEELARYNKDLEQFVNAVSATLRNPLSNMLNVLDSLKKDDGHDEELKSYFNLMETSIQKLDDVIADIEVQSESFQTKINPEVIDVDAMIEEQLELMQFMPGATTIEKDVKVVTDEVLFSDPYHLSVILNNLISNSIKYHDPTKRNPFLKIQVHVTKARAYFEFRDNGIGIDEKSVSRIFEMFFRANGNQDGTGIGLHLVKNSVDKLQGTIDVKSSVGIGTIFKIQLPNLLPPDRTVPKIHYSDRRDRNRNRAATA